jgi:membrane-associated phospholipid phosphatase
MVSMDIQSKSCRHLEFGNPSSHTFGASAMFLTSVFLLVKHYTVRYNIKNYMLPLMVLMNIAFLGVWIVGFSRVFLGAHTYNQVVSGIV